MVSNKEPKKVPPPPKGRGRMDLTKSRVEIEAANKERSLLLDRNARMGRYSGNQLMRAFNSQANPEVLNRMTRSLQAYMSGTPRGSSSARSAGDNAYARTLMRSGPSSWEEMAPSYKALEDELKGLDAEIAVRDVDLKERIIRATGEAGTGPLPADGASPYIKEGSDVVGSAFKWTKTGDRTTYMNDLSWPQQNPSTTVEFKGGRYGEVTRQLDIPGGNIHSKPGMATRERRPVDRKSTTSEFLKKTFSNKKR